MTTPVWTAEEAERLGWTAEQLARYNSRFTHVRADELQLYKSIDAEYRTLSESEWTVGLMDAVLTRRLDTLEGRTKFLEWVCQYWDIIHDAEYDKPVLQADMLWKKIHETKWDDMKSVRELHAMNKRTFLPIYLGTLINHGTETMLRLEPCTSALDDGYSEPLDTVLKFTTTCASAIKHDLNDPSDDSTHGMEKFSDEEALFRFFAVGWVMIERNGEWKQTGHVLVLDLHRNLQPWFVLAASWWDNGEDWEDEGEVVPQRSLSQGQTSAPGILPGNTSWTPVGKVEGAYNGNLETCFNNEARFSVKRTGGRRVAQRLPLLMDWYEDTNGDEVAYLPDGKECYRYRDGQLKENHRQSSPSGFLRTDVFWAL